MFLNGQLVLDIPIENLTSTLGYGFIDNIDGIDTGYLGKTCRNAGSGASAAFEYPYTGVIDEILVFDRALSENYLEKATCVVPTNDVMYAAKGPEIMQSSDAVAIDADTVSTLAEMVSGTIIAKFTPTQLNSVHSLIGISNCDDGQANSHFHIYVASGRLGYEIRRQSGGDFMKSVVSVDISANQTYIMAFVASETEGYKLFLNGELVQVISPSDFPLQGMDFCLISLGLTQPILGKPNVGVMDFSLL